VIDATLPMYDEDSGSLRIYTLLKVWVSLGYRLTFFPDNLDGQFKYGAFLCLIYATARV